MILGVGIVTLYLVIGAGLAKWDLPRAWERARREYEPDYMDDLRRGAVKGSVLLMLFLWPLAAPYPFIDGLLTRAVVEADPQERERKLELEAHDAKVKELEQQRYIKKLEKELGIGNDEA